MTKQLKARGHVVLAALSVGLEAAAIGVVLTLNELMGLGIAAALHLGAAYLSLHAARRRRKDLNQVESDLVLSVALLVPVFGPILAWFMPPEQAHGDVENAHTVFERYADHVNPHVPDYERTLFTGDYEKDLARELDAESYHEVLRHGSTDQKRNALRRLATLGDLKHFELIRNCLLDPEHEVRLYAYSELERAGQPYEEEIAKRARQLAREPENGEALLAMARAYYEYAASGIQDERMAAFYFRAAERYAGQARASGIYGPEPIWLRARAFTRLGEFEEAERLLTALDVKDRDAPESCLARADLAFRRRNFGVARTEAQRLKAAGAELPEWLAALEVEA
ncbi:MAG: hypothetical protein ACYSX0_15670 [Planctomycetota bacterium]|jgi:hypothetical protein